MRIQDPRSIYMESFNRNSYRLVINCFHKKSPSHMVFGSFLNVPLVGHCTKKKFPADLVTFSEEILDGKLHFL